ncbi:hypothetical protein BH09VER1_BH09VER1_23770 [soil metagenome]
MSRIINTQRQKAQLEALVRDLKKPRAQRKIQQAILETYDITDQRLSDVEKKYLMGRRKPPKTNFPVTGLLMVTKDCHGLAPAAGFLIPASSLLKNAKCYYIPTIAITIEGDWIKSGKFSDGASAQFHAGFISRVELSSCDIHIESFEKWVTILWDSNWCPSWNEAELIDQSGKPIANLESAVKALNPSSLYWASKHRPYHIISEKRSLIANTFQRRCMGIMLLTYFWQVSKPLLLSARCDLIDIGLMKPKSDVANGDNDFFTHRKRAGCLVVRPAPPVLPD